jgi:hypothetical protein
MPIEAIDDEDIEAISRRIREVISHAIDLDKNIADGVVRLTAALLPDFIRVRVDTPRLRDKFQVLFDRYQQLNLGTDHDESTIEEYIVAAGELLFWSEVMRALNEWAASN